MTSAGQETVFSNGTATLDSCHQLPLDLAFATDLLFHLDDVRAACASGLVAHSNLVTMLKSRIQLERTYAQELSKMTRFAQFDARESGTMHNAMASLRAQYLNTSVQHRHLAANLEEEVLQPIENLYARNSQRAQSLTRRLKDAKKDVKSQEDAYRKDYSAFDKHFREASASFAAAMDAGVSSTLLETRYHHSLSQLDVDRSASALVTRPHQAAGTGALSSMNNRKLVRWLLPSSDTHRKETVATTTVKLMAAAEKARRQCQETWQGVETTRLQMCCAVQKVLAEYQQLAEDRIVVIATNLRKHVVFASSALANEQYDWQTVAPNLENVDVRKDIHDFIHATRGKKERMQLARLTVNDLCNATAPSLVASPSSKLGRPLRKSCLEIRDVSAKKVPFDYDGNQELLHHALGAYLSASCVKERTGPNELSCLHRDPSAFSATLAALQATDEDDGEEKRASRMEPEVDGDDLTPSESPSESGDTMNLDPDKELEASEQADRSLQD